MLTASGINMRSAIVTAGRVARRHSSTAAAAAAAAVPRASAPAASSASATTPRHAHAFAKSLSAALSAALQERAAQATYAAVPAAPAAPTATASASASASSASPAAPAVPAPAPWARVCISAPQLRRAQRIAARKSANARVADALRMGDDASDAGAAPPSSTSDATGSATPAPPASTPESSGEFGGGAKLHPGVHTRDLKPSELVRELDRFIIGQGDAKKAVAVALRNRWRRHRLPEDLRQEVMPKNILMIGPTGCGKTEIARRLARLTESPFIKVEATKFTEVGFHGKDVDSIISDLLRVAIAQLKVRRKAEARQAIQRAVQDKILEALTAGGSSAETFRATLEAGGLEGIEIEIELPERDPSLDSVDDKGAGSNRRDEVPSFKEFAAKLARQLSGRRSEMRRLTIAEARPLLEEAHMDQLYQPEEVLKDALKAVREDGIVFIDEIDKICTGGKDAHRGADASAEGVQRDLLPLLEGTTVTTKQGDIPTDHILFIASGAFHAVKPSDLMAELQGRLPIRVELQALSEDELYRILTSTENNLCQQQVELLEVDKVALEWTDAAKREIAKVACEVNRSVENIGARRLATVIERIVDDLSYSASDVQPGTRYTIDAPFVRLKVQELLKTTDLGKFML